ncbi:probable transcriptional regulator [Oceanicola granulosus HTCC2516]|uniref:Probable transcriptional regulator n=1 Tax=Oceanicola granulosus (strain ATCC BAA-861 / DSM 15982 / KCTC 12143 / HTCC2516) TaxID=314256 RepID=Q2CJI5_OCEGH|nr:GntR family transcriptional regulator [Oceanicola granulosus]EAR53154.1 probable transcriptional regulator [Oceanicola granulosus HTCC2516]
MDQDSTIRTPSEAPKPPHERPLTVATRLRADIVAGLLPQGARLKTQELAARYGTSINPIREALHQLAGEGFVQIERNRGARVRVLDETLVRNMFDVRALIEPYLIRLFVSHATERELSRLAELQDRIETIVGEDQERLRALDAHFHDITYAGHHNTEALAIFQRQSRVVQALGIRFPASPARRQAQNHEHRALIDAAARGLEDEAAEIVRQHCRGAERHLLEQLRRN